MGLFSKKSNQDFGEYLPSDEAQLQQESVPIQAKNQQDADEKCSEAAKEYDGFDSEATPVNVGTNDYDCKFKVWR